MYKTMQFHIRGVSGLMMHNPRLANPLDPIVKQIKSITKKRIKTDADIEEVARLEWHGGLYLHEGKPCVRSKCLKATIVNAARRRKRGKDVQAGLFCYGEFPLVYDGPQTVEGLWNDERFRDVRLMGVNGKSRILRTRPYFPEWALSFALEINDEVVNPSEVLEYLQIGGELVGLLEDRPEQGRYIVEI